MNPPPHDQESSTIDSLEATNSSGCEAGNSKLEAVREILVGEEFHDLSDRFQDLEESITSRQAWLRNELGTLQAESKAEIKDVGDMVVEMVGQLQHEDTAHAEGIEKIGLRLTELEQRVDTKNDVLSEQVRVMHEEFSAQISELTGMIKDQHDDVARQTVSRTDIAEILSGLAGKLGAERSDSGPSEDSSPS